MSSLKLNSSGGGSVTLTPASTASNLTATVPAVADTLAVQGQLGLRNKIINGAMMIDQRNAGASVTNNATVTQYSLDRWSITTSVSAKFTAQQSSDAPTGFLNSLLITSLSSYSVLVGDYYEVTQRIEGLNCSDLGFGSANAKTVTLSFWVKSSLTGTFGGALQNAAGNRSYPYTYTISSANTWEQKSITIAGDTTGTWVTTNGVGLRVIFGLGVGSTYSGTAGSWAAAGYESATGATSVVGTNGATFYITGVQLEKGATATPFENRLYGTELALCQRYYWQQNYTVANTRFGTGIGIGSATIDGIMINLPVPMRAVPTCNLSSCGVYDGSTTQTITALSTSYSTNVLFSHMASVTGAVSAGKIVQIFSNTSSAYVYASAEL